MSAQEKVETFTPGPWSWDHAREPSALLSSAGDVLRSEEGLSLSWVITVGPADAHLIAAAPELYEALETALKNFKALIDAGLTPGLTGLALHFGEVLAKARGETP